MQPASPSERLVKLHSFFAELKRRNVYKVAVAYAVVSWLLIQAASIFFPAFDAPPWVMKIFIIVIIFGFPVALIFSWAFEITPEGIKLESEIEPNKSIKREHDRAIEVLQKLVSIPSYINYAHLKFHPLWKPLRGNPKFEKIVTSLAPKAHIE